MTTNQQLVDQTWWRCWAILHDSHGLSLDTVIWLPEGQKPEDNSLIQWVRLGWLDGPNPQGRT